MLKCDEMNFIRDTLLGKMYETKLKDGRDVIVKAIPVEKNRTTDLQLIMTIYNKMKILNCKHILIPTKYEILENCIVFYYENLKKVFVLSEVLDTLSFEQKMRIAKILLKTLDEIHSKNYVFKNLFIESTCLDENYDPYFDCFNMNCLYDNGALISKFGKVVLEDSLFLPPEFIQNSEKTKRTDIYLAAQLIHKMFFGYYYDGHPTENKYQDERLNKFLKHLEKLIDPDITKRESNVFFLYRIFNDENNNNTLNNKHYEIKVIDNTVYLRTIGELNPNVEEIEKNFLDNNIYNYDIERIIYAIEHSNGEFISIGETFKIAPDDYNSLLNISISPNEMVCKARKTKNVYLYKSLIKFILKKNGIMYGHLDDNIERLSTANDEEYITVAVGKEPKHGEDATVNYCFNFYNEEKDLYKDLKDINFIITVNKDQVLAIKKPATQGEPGINIFGNDIPPKPGKDIDIPVGENTYLSEDGLKLCAALDGYIELTNGVVNVKELLWVKNLDYSVGNLKYPGSIIINGDVLPEFTAEADGDIQVEGLILGGNLKARNIFIKNGVYGKNISKLEAINTIIADFVENAYLYASDIEINKYIYNSTINCNNFSCIKGKGIVKSCKIDSTTTFRCNFLGSSSYHETYITISREAKKILLSQIFKLVEKISEIKKMLEHVEIKISGIKFQYGNQPDLYLKDEIYIDLTKKSEKLKEHLKNLNYRLENLQEKTKKCEEQQEVYINNRVFANTIIKFNDETIVFHESRNGPIRIYCDDGKMIKVD